jgi:hypothetical protein
MIRTAYALPLVAACLLVLGASDAGAQGFGGTGTGSNGSLFGGSSVGGSGGLGGSNSFGPSAFGGGLGQGGLGQGGLGQGGLGSGIGNNSAFGGQSASGSSGFVGRDSVDVTGMFDSMTRQSQQFTDVISRIERSVNRGNQNDGEQARSKVRVRLKMAFDNPLAAQSVAAVAFDGRMRKILAERQFENVTYAREGGAVTIFGTAASEFDRTVLEKLVGFDPAVQSVTNQMTVSEAIAAPTPQE